MGLLQRVIKNDSIKTDPSEIYNLRVFLLSIIVSGILNIKSN